MNYLKQWHVVELSNKGRNSYHIRVHCHVNGVFLGEEWIFSPAMIFHMNTFRDLEGGDFFKRKLNEIMYDIFKNLTRRLDKSIERHLKEFPLPVEVEFEYTVEDYEQ